MANTNKSRTDTSIASEKPSIDPVIDGIEDTSNVITPSETTVRPIIGYINDGLTPIYDHEETYKMVFAGYQGDKKIYR